METSESVSLEHILDVGLLAHHLLEGNIARQVHPTLELCIYNYTPKAVTVKDWDDTLSLCRGLIVHQRSGNVVARPFKKFWNMNTPNKPETMFLNLPTTQPQIVEKMDGSLGIYYELNGYPAIATRGSFESEQAVWASEWYRRHLASNPRSGVWLKGWTPLFEIIYPENRIVCKYEYSGLVLLGMINNSTGEEMPHDELRLWAMPNNIRYAKVYQQAHNIEYKPDNLATWLEKEEANREGYVVTWFDPYIKVKVKFAEYCRLHKVITGLNLKTLWEMLSDPGKTEEYTKLINDETLPKEFSTWLFNLVCDFNTAYKNIELSAIDAWYAQPVTDCRKEKAAYFTAPERRHLSSILFAMLDGKDYSKLIWKMIKPSGDRRFRVDGEQ